MYLFIHTGASHVITNEDISEFYIICGNNLQEFVDYVKKITPDQELEDIWIEDKKGRKLIYPSIHA